MIKPAKPARENISPSDLTFGLSTCKRCLWIKYWFKVTMPVLSTCWNNGSVARGAFSSADMPTIDPSLRAGKVTKWGEWVKRASPLLLIA
jgi:hypothetical protein